ncbi:uncharacterized protein LOC127251025 isoform X2 [Andrographis paniculata]|nr:uncharacterized protein LOC127251025 isoform X2 [Andrographis paniculata]
MGTPAVGKAGFLRNIPVRLILFSVFLIAIRSAYVVIIRGKSCDVGDFCFVSLPESFAAVSGGNLRKSASAAVVTSSGETAPSTPKKIPKLWATEGFQTAVEFYSSIFQDLIGESILRPNFKALCVDTAAGADVFALREIGVEDSVGVAKKDFKPMVVAGKGSNLPFINNTFDFVFCAAGTAANSASPATFAAEIDRTLKPEGFLIVHTRTNDTYSFHSLLNLFSFCKFLRTKNIAGFDPQTPFLQQIVLQKLLEETRKKTPLPKKKKNKCSVPTYKQSLANQAEPLIAKEPKKPWITLKRNLQNMKYLPSMVDISFKTRYIYIDVGARSYGSSIVSWFKKQYPKQNKTFEIFAVEADRAFHDQYRGKKGVTLLPYAAWVRNETLFFDINGEPGKGMGRIRPAQSSAPPDGDRIEGFDFGEWLKRTVSERDYVVMKMDVEGTEFDLIPKLFENGGICLIDELFLECHYNRWQKCCPGKRSTKYQKTYGQCLELFTSLRETGVLVHQW